MTFPSVTDGIKYFVENYKNDLMQSLSGSGIYFAVCVGQICQESGFGTVDRARLHNNFIGIKNFGTLKYPGVIGKTKTNYAIFDSPKSCFDAYVKILKDPTKQYMKQGLLSATNPYDQLKAIAYGGYCQNPPDPMAYYKPVSKIMAKCLSAYSIGKIG